MVVTSVKNPNRCPTHPGALLREDILPALKLPKTAIADELGISRQHLYDILRERKPIRPQTYEAEAEKNWRTLKAKPGPLR